MKQNGRLIKNHHKLQYNVGFIEYEKLESILKTFIKADAHVIVRGSQKCQFLRELVPLIIITKIKHFFTNLMTKQKYFK